jgi:hypothetical protein
MTPNFIPTVNPFGLATPPIWFLARLYAYDADLRIFPSTCKPVYQMGRKGRHGGTLGSPNPQLPDTLVFHQHGIWPWKELVPQEIGFGWERILLDLPEYDTQRFLDPAAQLDGVEADAEAKLDAAIADEADQRAGAMYRTLKTIVGSRVGAGSRPEGAGYRKLGAATPRASRRRVHRPRAAGAGAMWTGR